MVVSRKGTLLWAACQIVQLFCYLRSMLGPQVMCIPAVSLLRSVYPLLDEGLMWRAWCLRVWEALVVKAPEWPPCSTGWTAACWNTLKFVKVVVPKSRSHDQNKGNSRYKVVYCPTFNVKLTLLLIWFGYNIYYNAIPSHFFFSCYDALVWYLSSNSFLIVECLHYWQWCRVNLQHR